MLSGLSLCPMEPFIFDHFNFLAPIYDRVIQPKTPDTLTSLMKLSPPDLLLDVGGGTGRISQYFSGQVQQIVVADLSFKMLGMSQLKDGLSPVNSHSEKLPFPNETFDRIIMVDALHHVCDQQDTANELWRILKHGGRLIIEEPNIHHWAVKLIAFGEKIALMRSHFLDPTEIANLFKPFPGETHIHYEDYISWVVIDK